MQCLVSIVCVWEVEENSSWPKTLCMKYSLPQLGCLVSFEILAAGVQAVIEKKFKTATFDSITQRNLKILFWKILSNNRCHAHISYVRIMLEAVRGNSYLVLCSGLDIV